VVLELAHLGAVGVHRFLLNVTCLVDLVNDDLGVAISDESLSYGPPWAPCLDGYQDRLLRVPLGLLGLWHTAPDGVGRKDYGEEVLG
jgi:hypothetical protein